MIKGRGAIESDGKLTLVTDGGTFEVGAAALERILAKLAAQGIVVSNQTPPEQHRHDETEHTHTHEKGVQHG